MAVGFFMASSRDNSNTTKDNTPSFTQGRGLFYRPEQDALPGLTQEQLGAYLLVVRALITKAGSMAGVREESFYDDAIAQLQTLEKRMSALGHDDNLSYNSRMTP